MKGVNLMIHKNCQKTEEDACRCSQCHSRFCHEKEGDREVKGRYVFDDKMYCIDCWNKNRRTLRNV